MDTRIPKLMGGKSRSLLLVGGAGIFAAILMFWITTLGPGVGPDSLEYLKTAENILEGNGFLISEDEPLAQWPPVYPILLSVAGFFHHGDVVEGSRWLHALLFGLNLALIGVLVWLCTEGNWVATGGAMLVSLASAQVISVHAMIMSEAPFIAFSLASFGLLSLYLRRPSLARLLAASVAFGAALTTRYVGITLLPPMVLGICLFGIRPVKTRIKDALIATCVACFPLGAWLIRNVASVDSATGRSFTVHPFGLEHAKALILTMHDFILPLSIGGWFKVLNLAVAAVFVIAIFTGMKTTNFFNRRSDSPGVVIPVICILFFLTYLCFLLFSISFLDSHTPVDGRILITPFIFLVIGMVSLAWSASRAMQNQAIWWGFSVLILISIMANARIAVPEVVDIHSNGSGYSSLEWKKSPTMSLVRSIPRETRIYSNGPDIIRFLANRNAIMIPRTINPITRMPMEKFNKRLMRMCSESRDGDAMIVYLDGIDWRWYLVDRERLVAVCPLPIFANTDDGIIYGG